MEDCVDDDSIELIDGTCSRIVSIYYIGEYLQVFDNVINYIVGNVLKRDFQAATSGAAASEFFLHLAKERPGVNELFCHIKKYIKWMNYFVI